MHTVSLIGKLPVIMWKEALNCILFPYSFASVLLLVEFGMDLRPTSSPPAATAAVEAAVIPQGKDASSAAARGAPSSKVYTSQGSHSMFDDLDASGTGSDGDDDWNTAAAATGPAAETPADNAPRIPVSISLSSAEELDAQATAVQQGREPSPVQPDAEDLLNSSSDFSISEPNDQGDSRVPAAGDGSGTFGQDASAGSQLGWTGGSSLFGDVSLPAGKLAQEEHDSNSEASAPAIRITALSVTRSGQPLPPMATSSPLSPVTGKPSSIWEQTMREMQKDQNAESSPARDALLTSPVPENEAEPSEESDFSLPNSDGSDMEGDEADAMSPSFGHKKTSDRVDFAGHAEVSSEDGRASISHTPEPPMSPTMQHSLTATTRQATLQEETRKAEEEAQHRRLEQERLAQEAEGTQMTSNSCV